MSNSAVLPSRPSQQVTFIFQSDGNTTGLNKSSINAHIARQTHKRHRDQQKRLQEPRKNADRKGRPDTISTSITRLGAGKSPSNDSGYESASPSPIVLAGNSDPFSSKAIAITAEVNHLLTFTRDFILPAFHIVESSVAGGRLHMHRFWEDMVNGLDGGCAGYAYLSRSAAIMSTIAADNQTSSMALEFRTLATGELRKQMVKLGTQPLAWDVYALLCAEVAARSFDSAAIHGQMLRRLLQADAGPLLKCEPRLLMAILREDITRACLSLARPSFDLHRWATEHLPTSILDNLEDGADYPSAFPIVVELSQSLTGGLRDIFLRIREWIHVLGVMMLHRQLYDLTLLINGAMSIMVQEGHLLNHYLDCMQQWTLDSSREALEDAGMSLAALYWVRRAAHEGMGKGSKLELAGSYAFNMSPMVVMQLRYLHEHLEVGERERSAAQRLWTLYVGALAERTVGPRMECGDYHSIRFRNLVKTERFRDWSSVEDSLNQFLYVDMTGLEARP